MTFEKRGRAIGMLTAGMLARDVDRHFQRHKSTIRRLLNRFQPTQNVTDRSRSSRPRKPRRFRRNRFLSSRKLGCLLRNAPGTRVCDRTIRNMLHAGRLKACRPYLGIPLTLRNYRACCICNNIPLGFSMIKPVDTLQGIPRTFYASITSMCCSGLQDHRVSLPLSSYGST